MSRSWAQQYGGGYSNDDLMQFVAERFRRGDTPVEIIRKVPSSINFFPHDYMTEQNIRLAIECGFSDLGTAQYFLADRLTHSMKEEMLTQDVWNFVHCDDIRLKADLMHIFIDPGRWETRRSMVGHAALILSRSLDESLVNAHAKGLSRLIATLPFGEIVRAFDALLSTKIDPTKILSLMACGTVMCIARRLDDGGTVASLIESTLEECFIPDLVPLIVEYI